MRFWGLALLVLILDQGSKWFVLQNIERGESIEIIGKVLSFTHVQNPGAAFGFFAYQTWLFIVVTILIGAIIIYYNYRLPATYKYTHAALGILLGGAAGNLIDRIDTGYVIDFISVVFWPPIFNVADMAIVAGIILFIISLWVNEKEVLT